MSSSPHDRSEGLKGLKKFLAEAKEILKFNPDDKVKVEQIDEMLAKIDPMIAREAATDEMAQLLGSKPLVAPRGSTSPPAPGWGKLSPKVEAPATKTESYAPFPDMAHKKTYERLEGLASAITPPPSGVLEAFQTWLRDKWKTAAYWDSLDQVEQTWHLQALARALFKGGGINRGPEFIPGTRAWTSELIGEIRKLGMGEPSVIWLAHEVVHLALEIEEEEPAWVATIRLIKDAFADIDPAYADQRLKEEFDNQKPLAAGKQRGWAPK